MGKTNGSKKKLSNIPKLKPADRKKLGLTGPKSNQVGSGTKTKSGGLEVTNRTSAEVKPGSKPPSKEYNWLGLEKGDGGSQEKVVAGLEGASDLMGEMADKRNAAMSGLVGGTGGVGKGAAVSSSGVVRDQDYQGYTEKKKKYGLT